MAGRGVAGGDIGRHDASDQPRARRDTELFHALPDELLHGVRAHLHLRGNLLRRQPLHHAPDRFTLPGTEMKERAGREQIVDGRAMHALEQERDDAACRSGAERLELHRAAGVRAPARHELRRHEFQRRASRQAEQRVDAALHAGAAGWMIRVGEDGDGAGVRVEQREFVRRDHEPGAGRERAIDLPVPVRSVHVPRCLLAPLLSTREITRIRKRKRADGSASMRAALAGRRRAAADGFAAR